MTMIVLLVTFSCLMAAANAAGCQRVVCYYTNWAQYRPKPFKFFPEDINTNLCTHINYAFATMTGNHLKAYEWNDETEPWMKGMFERTVDMIRQSNPSAHLLLSVGGWNMGSAPFTAMVATPAGRTEFAVTSASFLRIRNFTGLDLDWEYPASRGSPPQDKQNYVELLKELNRVFTIESFTSGKPKLLLTAAVSAGKAKTEAGYNVPEVAKYLDFINIMTYDLHGSWEDVTGHNSPLYARAGETGNQATLNVDWAARHWVNLGLPKHKLVLGLATYGRSFTLTRSHVNGLGAAVTGPGSAGVYTREPGFKSYYEICEMIKSGATVMREHEQKVPYLYTNRQWVGYDDETSLKEKVRYMKNSGYGGVMIWSLDLDDFTGSCGKGQYPLLNAINNECAGIAATSPPASSISYMLPEARSSLPPSVPQPISPSLWETPAKVQTNQQRPDTNQYSARHGSQIMMFQIPDVGTPKQDLQVNNPRTSVQQVVSSSSSEFVLPNMEGGRQILTPANNAELILRPSPNFQTFSQRMSSFMNVPRTPQPVAVVQLSQQQNVPITIDRNVNPTQVPVPNNPSTINWSPPVQGPQPITPIRVASIPLLPLTPPKTQIPSGESSLASKAKLDSLLNFLKEHSSRTSLLPSNFMKNLLPGDRGSEHGGAKTNRFSDDSTEYFNCITKPDGFYPSPASCKHFFICESSQAFLRTCDNGLVYNPNYKFCDWSYNYQCEDNVNVRTQPASFCDRMPDGRYADPSTCNNYIDCVSFNTYVMPCAQGTVYSASTNGCNIPQNVPECNK